MTELTLLTFAWSACDRVDFVNVTELTLFAWSACDRVDFVNVCLERL